jgi:phosphate:Na+ symporter
VMIGGSLAVRRAALGHIVFSLVVGVLAMFALGPLTAAAAWVGTQLDDPDGVLALAAFSSIFKLAGIVVFYPWLDAFSRLIVRISGTGSDSAVSRLDPTLAEAGGDVVMEAAWRALLEVARGAVDATRRRLAGEPVQHQPAIEAVEQIGQFLESLPLETTDLGTIGPRLIRLTHAEDHLRELQADLTRIPAPGEGPAPAGFEAGARALAGWLEATTDPEAAPAPAVFQAGEDARKGLSEERRAGRDAVLEDLALQRTRTAAARTRLEVLRWGDGALYHAWRLVDSLRIASGR